MNVLSASRRSSAEASLVMVSSEQSTLNQASQTSFSWLNIVPEIDEVNRTIDCGLWADHWDRGRRTSWKTRRTQQHTCGTSGKMPPRLSKTWGRTSTRLVWWLQCGSPSIHSSSTLEAGLRQAVEVQCWIVLARNARDWSQAGSKAWESQDQRNLGRNWLALNYGQYFSRKLTAAKDSMTDWLYHLRGRETDRWQVTRYVKG